MRDLEQALAAPAGGRRTGLHGGRPAGATIPANIVALNSAHGIAIVYITTAYHVADEVLVLHRGHVVERGDAANVIVNPQHDHTRLLVSSIPWPDLDRRWGDGESTAGRRASTQEYGTTP